MGGSVDCTHVISGMTCPNDYLEFLTQERILRRGEVGAVALSNYGADCVTVFSILIFRIFSHISIFNNYRWKKPVFLFVVIIL